MTDSKESEATVSGLTQCLCERLESGMFLVFLVWVTDRMLLFMEKEPQPKEWIQERKLDLGHVEFELTLDYTSKLPVGSFFIICLFCFSIKV